MVSVCRVAERVDNVLLVSTSVARVVVVVVACAGTAASDVIVVRAAIRHKFGRTGPLASSSSSPSLPVISVRGGIVVVVVVA